MQVDEAEANNKTQKAEQHEYPWLALITHGKKPSKVGDDGLCTGSLISPSFVLTAAHCLGDKNTSEVHVWLGLHNRTKVIPSELQLPTEKIFQHPAFNNTGDTLDHDVGLIKLNGTITMSDEIRPVCLPMYAEDFEMINVRSKGEVAGWGVLNKPGDEWARPAKVPRKDNFPIEPSKSKCQEFFRVKNKQDITYTENMFCAGYSTGLDALTCKGDSGAAFMVDQSHGKYNGVSKKIVLGVVSFGINYCRRKNSYSFYATLDNSTVQWINEQMRLN